jgi:hypothetical protein
MPDRTEDPSEMIHPPARSPASPVPDAMSTHPTVFISYSWDDEVHKDWARVLATQLRADGVVRLDHWHAVPGDRLISWCYRVLTFYALP